ncbi:MAG TPA: hypothetical protein RMH99_22610 [Sandaracinaceae bacterium LLY-WYZ-13_1]|nr:hypothetical protein [Sandaracinaceae bacterium LLY-WYZ-13_1]
MRQLLALALGLATLGLASTTAAQVTVVEEEQVEEEQVVERGYVRGQGRGIQYGAHLISPIYLLDVTRAGARDPAAYLAVGGGAGVLGRVGWEFPDGFTLEVFGGFAANGIDTRGTDASNILLRTELGAGGRYMFFNETAVVPFVQVGAGIRWWWFDWTDVAVEMSAEPTFAIHGAVGVQIELSPYFGIEGGATIDYAFGHEIFGDGMLAVTPFLGVTLYVYDENDR